jgi:SNF2 family DNA or RNA helicase
MADLEVSQHPRGMEIRIADNSLRIEIARRLRTQVPADFVFYSNGRYIVPPECAYLIAREFSSVEAHWQPELEQLAIQQEAFQTRLERARLQVAEALSEPEESLLGYSLIHILDAHQVEAVAAMSVPDLVGISLFDEQGLGKTVMALCAFDRCRETDLVDCLVVIAPKSVLASWSDDIKRILADKFRIKTVAGTSNDRRRIILSEWDILLISYETAASDVDTIQRRLRNIDKRIMLVIDESYYVKNPDARRSKAVSEIRLSCDRAVVLCGTPAPNSPRDLIHQLNVADARSSQLGQAIPSTDDEDLKQYVAQLLDNAIYLRRLKEQALPTLPVKEMERIYVELQPLQRRLYDYARADLINAVRSVDDREFARKLTSFLALRAKLLQICSNPGSVDPTYTEMPAKLLALDKLVHEIVEQRGEKIVIWSYYRFSAEAIASRFARHGLVRIDGSVTRIEDRQLAIKKFQRDDQTRIFLGNAAAAGAGITLTAARHAIYESLSDQAAHYMQSVDRIHRRGQEHPVSIHVILAQGTLEERQFQKLTDKQLVSRNLLGDGPDTTLTKERFLRDLTDIASSFEASEE